MCLFSSSSKLNDSWHLFRRKWKSMLGNILRHEGRTIILSGTDYFFFQFLSSTAFVGLTSRADATIDRTQPSWTTTEMPGCFAVVSSPRESPVCMYVCMYVSNQSPTKKSNNNHLVVVVRMLHVKFLQIPMKPSKRLIVHSRGGIVRRFIFQRLIFNTRREKGLSAEPAGRQGAHE